MISMKFLNSIYGIFIWIVVFGLIFSSSILAISFVYSPELFGLTPSYLLFVGFSIISISLSHGVYLYTFIKYNFSSETANKIGLSNYIIDHCEGPMAFLSLYSVLESISTDQNLDICEKLRKRSAKIAFRQKLLSRISLTIMVLVGIAFVIASTA